MLNARGRSEGETALWLASSSEPGSKDMEAVVEALLEAGADANIARFNGASPLFIASQCGNAPVRTVHTALRLTSYAWLC